VRVNDTFKSRFPLELDERSRGSRSNDGEGAGSVTTVQLTLADSAPLRTGLLRATYQPARA
jgi:hypothetical protein